MPDSHLPAKDALAIGKTLEINWQEIDFDQFRRGLEVEAERGKPRTDVVGDDPIKTGRIVLAHLAEVPDYYSRLAVPESEADANRRNSGRSPGRNFAGDEQC